VGFLQKYLIYRNHSYIYIATFIFGEFLKSENWKFSDVISVAVGMFSHVGRILCSADKIRDMIYDKMRSINVRSKADRRASLI